MRANKSRAHAGEIRGTYLRTKQPVNNHRDGNNEQHRLHECGGMSARGGTARPRARIANQSASMDGGPWSRSPASSNGRERPAPGWSCRANPNWNRVRPLRADKQMSRGEILNRDESGWNQKHKRAGHPHDHARATLVAESGGSEQPRRFQIPGIEHMVGEREDGGQRGVQQIGGEQIDRHRPERPLRPAGERANDGPPKEERRAEETAVLDLVPCGRAEGEFKRRRHVPGTERQCHHNPAIQWKRNRVRNPA